MNLGYQVYTAGTLDLRLDPLDEASDVAGAGRSGIDDEVGVLFRHLGTSLPHSLQSRRLGARRRGVERCSFVSRSRTSNSRK